MSIISYIGSTYIDLWFWYTIAWLNNWWINRINWINQLKKWCLDSSLNDLFLFLFLLDNACLFCLSLSLCLCSACKSACGSASLSAVTPRLQPTSQWNGLVGISKTKATSLSGARVYVPQLSLLRVLSLVPCLLSVLQSELLCSLSLCLVSSPVSSPVLSLVVSLVLLWFATERFV